jgi:BolA protein
MSITDEMRDKLQTAFQPRVLRIIDDSEAHRGHAGYKEGGESHFNVIIEDPVFEPMSRIARHRAIHEALGKDLVSRIHALALQVSG